MSNSVYSVELQQHVRYEKVTVGDLKAGDTFVLFFSDLGDDYRIHVAGRTPEGQIIATSTLSDKQTFLSVLKDDEVAYKVL